MNVSRCNESLIDEREELNAYNENDGECEKGREEQWLCDQRVIKVVC